MAFEGGKTANYFRRLVCIIHIYYLFSPVPRSDLNLFGSHNLAMLG
jgi:hypothetical protein